MTEWKGMTKERYIQLQVDPTLRLGAVGEIWGELKRMRNILFEIKNAHYAMIDWGIVEDSPDRDPERQEAYLRGLFERGIATTTKEIEDVANDRR